ncbi:glycoside hydrolase family protein [Massilibacteroides vaginae]|uniref:glycosylase n=1 Tax=Massilibacteroides vaginae TaxID=1673718 RepID=UPI000A1CD681|nr:glycosylase [Massilibacteroides vaginae]
MKINLRVILFAVSLLFLPLLFTSCSQPKEQEKKVMVDHATMNQVYEKVKTPYKYGLVVVPEVKNKMVDSPSVFRHGDLWYMIYIVFDGKGYETMLATSADLLFWETKGKILSFTENTWDANQKAGYVALQDYEWGGSYTINKFDNKYWMSYLGGATEGYEAGMLGIGVANTADITQAVEWNRPEHPVMLPTDPDARWYETETIYKSSVINDKNKTLGYPFVMFYNAKNKGEETPGQARAERIALAVSEDMVTWNRYRDEPVIDHGSGISGDAYITKMDDLWVMFYFGAGWRPKAFDRFACSYDLVNWTLWAGEDLITPSESYDMQYAHKPCVINYNGIVYHFYCAVSRDNGEEQRTIALATSKDLGKSVLEFPK